MFTISIVSYGCLEDEWYGIAGIFTSRGDAIALCEKMNSKDQGEYLIRDFNVDEIGSSSSGSNNLMESENYYKTLEEYHAILAREDERERERLEVLRKREIEEEKRKNREKLSTVQFDVNSDFIPEFTALNERIEAEKGVAKDRARNKIAVINESLQNELEEIVESFSKEADTLTARYISSRKA